jgi:Zn-finger in ubiquitin-hydrolases and other protein
MSGDVCSHTGQIDLQVVPDAEGECPDCVAIGGSWVHLRQCMSCGHVACCDDSPNKHASQHYGASGHPIIRSKEPGERWYWCFVDEVAFFVDDGRAG